jgi:hypothetical protein
VQKTCGCSTASCPIFSVPYNCTVDWRRRTRWKQDLLHVLDRLKHGVVLLDGGARILLMNHTADQLLRARDGLSLEQGELRAASPIATAALKQAIAESIEMNRGETLTSSGRLTIERPSRAPGASDVNGLDAHKGRFREDEDP